MNNYLEEKCASYQRTCLEIDLDAILENMRSMKKNVSSNTKMLGVIKADGYGHGAIPIAHCLEDLDYVYGYATATAEEAHILRKAGIKKPILILGYTFPYCYEQLIKEEIRPTVFRQDTLMQLAEAAKRVGGPVKIHVKVDTGMSRVGIAPDESGLDFFGKILEYKELEIEGVFTHFAKADETDKSETMRQLQIFDDFVNRVEEELNIKIPLKHCANSAGILEVPEAVLDMVRAGIALYGLYPSEEVQRDIVPLKPALSWYSHIVYTKTIKAGQSVSYGGLFTASKEMRIATIPVGYGDGYPRSLTGKGYVLIHGRKAPILGRVCMDQFMVDITEIPGVKENDRVTLLGYDGGVQISAEELGTLSGRFNYELVCDISKRVPRVYFKGGTVIAVKDYHNDYE